jgi:putative ABC transport system permease protein
MTRTTLLLLVARLRSHRWRSLVLVAVIAVASGIALSAQAVFAVADDPWAPLVDATNGGDVELDSVSVRPDPEALDALPDVESVGVLTESGDGALQVGDEVLSLTLHRMPDRDALTIDRPLVMGGRWFRSPDEVVFEASFADTLGVDVGDEVVVSGEQSRTVRVVGTAATTMMPNYPERLPGIIFAGDVLYDAVDPVGDPGWSIGLKLHDSARGDVVADQLNEILSSQGAGCTSQDGGCARTTANIRSDAFPDRVDDLASTMLFFAVLMLIAAVMLVVTLLGSRLLGEARELTLLQVAGVTPGRLARLIALEHALLAAVGVLAGAVIARVVAPRIADSAATVFGSVSPTFTASDVVRVGVVAVACTAVVSAVAGLRAGRRSMAVVARGGSGRIHRSRIASVTLLASSWTTLVLGLKEVATRRGRAVVTVLTVTLAVTMAVTIVALAAVKLEARDPTVSPAATSATGLPSNPADFSGLPVWPSAVSGEVTGRIVDLLTTMQVLLGGVAAVTLLAAAAMTLQERFRELSTLHALGCTPGQLAGASAVSQGLLGMIGTMLGVPLGLALYFGFGATTGVESSVSPGAVGAVAIAAVAVAAAAAAIPALVIQRRPTSEALSAE